MIDRAKKLVCGSAGRFLLVGALNTAVGSAIMFGLYNIAGCSYWASSAANYILVSILSFFLNKRYTFKNDGATAPQAVRFAMSIIVCYAVAYGAAKPLMYRLLASASPGLRDNAALLTGMAIFTCLNYVGQRFFTFREKKH